MMQYSAIFQDHRLEKHVTKRRAEKQVSVFLHWVVPEKIHTPLKGGEDPFPP